VADAQRYVAPRYARSCANETLLPNSHSDQHHIVHRVGGGKCRTSLVPLFLKARALTTNRPSNCRPAARSDSLPSTPTSAIPYLGADRLYLAGSCACLPSRSFLHYSRASALPANCPGFLLIKFAELAAVCELAGRRRARFPLRTPTQDCGTSVAGRPLSNTTLPAETTEPAANFDFPGRNKACRCHPGARIARFDPAATFNFEILPQKPAAGAKIGRADYANVSIRLSWAETKNADGLSADPT